MTEESFYRLTEISRNPRRLPGESYNLIRRVFRRAGGIVLFVPIRTMQYLGVVSEEEIFFVDGAGNRSLIEVAWQNFRPQARSSVTDPVDYEVVYYASSGTRTMQWLQGEFHRALSDVERGNPTIPVSAASARVVTLPRKS